MAFSTRAKPIGKGLKRSARNVAVRPISKLGDRQRAVLNVLARRKQGTAVEIRDRIYDHTCVGRSDDATRKTHAIIRRLVSAGYVSRTGALGDARGKSGSVVTFSITNEGREARKARP